jgi:hypothetical protein
MQKQKKLTIQSLFGLLAFRGLFLFCFLGNIAQAEDWVYQVRKNDTLWNLTIDHLIDASYVEKVRRLNNIDDPSRILPGTQIRIPSKWIRQYPALVRVQNLQGSAQLQGVDGQLSSLKVGSIIMLDDTVITGQDSTMILGFLDGSTVMLQENSRLTIDRLMLFENTGMNDIGLDLHEGRMETQVTPNTGTARKFKIKTPATVTSVRGTDYRISAELEKQASRTEVIAGKVAVKAGDSERLVNAGYGTVAQLGLGPIKPKKLMPAPDIEAIPTVLLQVPIQFSLSSSVEGISHRVQIAKTAFFRDVLFDKRFTGNIVRGPDLPDGQYYLRIRAIDTQQLEGMNADKAIAINARPAAPFLVSPEPGAGVLEESPEFVWSAREGIDHYHFQLSTDPDFKEILIDKPEHTTVELMLHEKLALGKYYWRVAAKDIEGDGPFTDGQLLRRITPAPELEEPEISEKLLIIRSRAGLPEQTYHIQMAEDEDFTELLVDQQSVSPGFEIARPGGGEYYVRIRTIDPDGFIGPFGEAQTIDVPYENLYWLLALLPLLALLAL